MWFKVVGIAWVHKSFREVVQNIPKTKEYYQVASTIVEPSNLSENQVEEFENWLYNSDYTEELINNIDLIVEDRKEEWEKFLSVLGENGY